MDKELKMILGAVLVVSAFAYVRANVIDLDALGPFLYQQATPQKDFRYECPPGMVLSVFNSSHNRCDRQFGFTCSAVDGVDPMMCIWLPFQNGAVNDLDTLFNSFDFECPMGGVLTGVDTVMNKSHNDRKYRFKCCLSAATDLGRGVDAEQGSFTDCREFRLNPLFRKDGAVCIPPGYVCTTWRADRYMKSKEDRFHSIRCCRLSKCRGCRPYTMGGYGAPN